MLVVGTDFTEAGAARELSLNARVAVDLGLPVLGVVSGDAVVFTGGIGENDAEVRAGSLSGRGELGIRLDERRNRQTSSSARDVAAAGSRIRVLVVPTDEELEMARQAVALLSGR